MICNYLIWQMFLNKNKLRKDIVNLQKVLFYTISLKSAN